MANYITNIRGLVGSNVAQKQSWFTRQAISLDILPLSLYYYPVASDSDSELSSRLDGILSGISYGDNIILQLPTMLGDRYEQALIDKINVFRQVSNSKLVIAIHQVLEDKDEERRMINQYYNQADAIIVPSVHYGYYLQSLGLNIRNLIYLPIYDVKTELVQGNAPYSNQIHLLSNNEGVQRVTKKNINNWDKAPLSLYEKINAMNQMGGMGLIWPQNNDEEFHQQMTPSLEFTQFCLAGIPVIVKASNCLSRLIKNHNLGFVSESLSDAFHQISTLDRNDYGEMANNIRTISRLVVDGMFTSCTLQEAINCVQLSKIK